MSGSIIVDGPDGPITVVADPNVPEGARFATAPPSPIRFTVGRPQDPNPPEHLELQLTSLNATEALIDQLQVASRKLMLGQPVAITIIQGRLLTNG